MNPKRLFCLLLLSFLALTAPAAGQTGAGARREGTKNIEAEVDAYVKPYLEMGGFSGSILIARGGKVLLKKGYGMANYELGVPNTPQTKFHIASVSKPFTASAVMLLQERGLLSVSDPLSRFIPDYPNGDKITVHHLLTHTSGILNVNGLPDYETKSRFPQTPASLVEMFKNRPLIMQPGERYNYSNSNYNLLAYIIEKVSGRGYGEFLRENIFEPLAMRDMGHDGEAGVLLGNRADGYVPAGVDGLENAPYLDWTSKTGNGSLYSTVEDLYKWDRALYTEKPLKRSTLERMFTAHVEGIGYGWFISKRHNRRAVRISGRSPGFSAELQRYVDEDVCVIVLGNNYAPTSGLIADDLAAIVLGEKYEALPVVKPVTLTLEAADALAGRYEGGADFFVPGVSITVERKGGGLNMIWNANAPVTLVPHSDTKFFNRVLWATVTFVKDDRGEVTHLLYRYAGKDYPAKRVKGK
jgi:CubicO group peptidase (beta-lactamase class C family)